jgi:hypothetical protein
LTNTAPPPALALLLTTAVLMIAYYPPPHSDAMPPPEPPLIAAEERIVGRVIADDAVDDRDKGTAVEHAGARSDAVVTNNESAQRDGGASSGVDAAIAAADRHKRTRRDQRHLGERSRAS